MFEQWLIAFGKALANERVGERDWPHWILSKSTSKRCCLFVIHSLPHWTRPEVMLLTRQPNKFLLLAVSVYFEVTSVFDWKSITHQQHENKTSYLLCLSVFSSAEQRLNDYSWGYYKLLFPRKTRFKFPETFFARKAFVLTYLSSRKKGR